MQPLADAMYAADRDPVRTGIRKLIYAGKRPEVAEVDSVVNGIPLDSLSPRTLSWLASVYLMAGAAKQGNEVFYAAVNRNPDDFMLNFDFAYVMVSQKNWPEAIRYYLRCVGIRPDVAGIWRALGNAYRENGELERSLEALTHAVELLPNHSPIYVDLSRSCLELKDYGSAATAAREAIRLGSRLPMSHYCLGQALMGQEQFAEALVSFNQCKQLSESDPRNAIDTSEPAGRCRERIASGVVDENLQVQSLSQNQNGDECRCEYCILLVRP